MMIILKRFTSPGSKKASGFSLLELLLATSISSILVCSAFVEAKRSYRLVKKLSKETESSRAAESISPWLKKITESVDATRLSVLPRIKQEELAFSSGEPVRTGARNADGSDAIYYITAQGTDPARITDKKAVPDGMLARACFSETVTTREGEFNALTITADGVFEIFVQILNTSHGCQNILILETPPLVTKKLSKEDLLSAVVLIPLEAREIFFVDNLKNVRIIRLYGDEVIENQPILHGINRLSVSFYPIAPKLSGIEYKLRMDEVEYKLQFQTRLSREGFLNTLLNL